MIRLAYDTDLTDDQRQILEPHIPGAKQGGRPCRRPDLSA